MKKTFRAAKIRANTFDEDTNTIQVVWTTGAAVRRPDYSGEEYDEVLSLDPGAVNLDRLNAGAPLLDTHQDGEAANIIGKVVEGSAKIEDGRGIATILLSKAADVANTVQKIIEGTARNLSVGYWIEHSVRQDGDPPTVLVDKWQPLEISIVPVPADPGAQVRSTHRRRPCDRQTPAQRAATYAADLLTQSTQTRGQAHGAAEARKALAGPLRADSSKPAGFDRDAVKRGAREARKLLRK
jgi:phage head maturation protease